MLSEKLNPLICLKGSILAISCFAIVAFLVGAYPTVGAAAERHNTRITVTTDVDGVLSTSNYSSPTAVVSGPSQNFRFNSGLTVQSPTNQIRSRIDAGLNGSHTVIVSSTVEGTRASSPARTTTPKNTKRVSGSPKPNITTPAETIRSRAGSNTTISISSSVAPVKIERPVVKKEQPVTQKTLALAQKVANANKKAKTNAQATQKTQTAPQQSTGATVVATAHARASTTNLINSRFIPQQSLLNEISKYGWNANMAYSIAVCESSRNVYALNNTPGREYSVGLFQINLHAHPHLEEQALYDPAENIRQAYSIYQSAGWNAWRNCYRKVTTA